MSEEDTNDRNDRGVTSARASRFTDVKNQLARTNLDYALETILREAGNTPAQKANVSPPASSSARGNELSYEKSESQNKTYLTAGEESSIRSSFSEGLAPPSNKLDSALDSLLKDAETQAQNAKNEGAGMRSYGLDPAAERRAALQAAAKRRAEMESAVTENAAQQEEKKPFYERIDPKTARVLMVLPLIFVICIFLYCILVWPVKASVTIEAGESVPEANGYAWFSWQNLRYATADETAAYLKSHPDFSDQIDTTLPGRYSVLIRFALITYERSLLVADTTPPVIEGELDKTANIGTPFSYRQGITVTDNSSAPVTLTVEAGTVDLQTVGEYPVLYIATDSIGNRTAAEGTVSVVVAPKPPQSAEEEEVLSLAEGVVNEIVTSGMTYEEKARAIYDWEQQMMTFRETNQGKDNVTGNALQGLKNRNGDCHVFAATAEVLLTCAGIPNLRIENAAGNSVHEWNLINLGAGWHHFDTVVAQGVPAGSLFNLTSAELEEQATKKGFIHRFDAKKYPVIE